MSKREKCGNNITTKEKQQIIISLLTKKGITKEIYILPAVCNGWVEVLELIAVSKREKNGKNIYNKRETGKYYFSCDKKRITMEIMYISYQQSLIAG